MFWKANSTSSPQVEAVLQKEGVTLQDLMDEDDVIQECKLQNKKLIEFLCQRNILEELVTLITEEPSEELDERVRFKYPNIACELLTCDVPALNESLSRDNDLLEKLYSFIEKEPPLNPLLASFLSRTLGVLIVKRQEQQWISYQYTCLQAMGFLKEKENFISLLLKHLATSAIMDLTLKLVTEVGDADLRQNLLNWLDSQNLVQSLISLLDPKVDSERHHNVSQLLCDILRISRDTLIDPRERVDADPILARLESPEMVGLIMEYMLGPERTETSIVGGIQVLLALLGHKNNFNENTVAYNNTYDEVEIQRRQKVAESTALEIVRRLKDFHQILLEPPKTAAVKTSIGCLDPPLGNTRLQVTKLLAALISINKSEILLELINLGTIEVLLELFFKYVWNNFLHSQVEQCLAAAFKAHCKMNGSEENAMHSYLIIKCRLLGKILEAWDDNEQKQSKPKGVRQGYMGHLINIANNVVQESQKTIELDTYIKENVSKDTLDAWDSFVAGPLAETNKTQNIILGGVHPSNLTSDDSNDDYNMPYQQTAMLQQQMYNDMQLQQMAPELIESFGFQDGEFNDPDDPLHSSLERCSNINLNVNEGDLNRQAEIFKKVCSEYINTLDDADDCLFEEPVPVNRGNGKSGGDDSWDPRGKNNEEEADKKMDVDPWSSLEGNKNTVPITESIHNPWSNVEMSSTGAIQDGWADFGSFSTDFESQRTEQSSTDTDNASLPLKLDTCNQIISTEELKPNVCESESVVMSNVISEEECKNTEDVVIEEPEQVANEIVETPVEDVSSQENMTEETNGTESQSSSSEETV